MNKKDIANGAPIHYLAGTLFWEGMSLNLSGLASQSGVVQGG